MFSLKKSLANKLIILSQSALLLGYFAPWAITPILILGGTYLYFAGYEKVHCMFTKLRHVEVESVEVKIIKPAKLEKERVAGAVRTDIIFSAEIMVLVDSQITDQTMVNQIVVMLAVVDLLQWQCMVLLF